VVTVLNDPSSCSRGLGFHRFVPSCLGLVLVLCFSLIYLHYTAYLPEVYMETGQIGGLSGNSWTRRRNLLQSKELRHQNKTQKSPESRPIRLMFHQQTPTSSRSPTISSVLPVLGSGTPVATSTLSNPQEMSLPIPSNSSLYQSSP